MNWDSTNLNLLIEEAFKEDLGSIGDITTDAIISDDLKGSADLFSKANGVICGLDIFSKVFKYIDDKIEIIQYFKDGDKVSFGDKILTVSGKLNSILKSERVSLNFIQRLSGIASKVNLAVKILDNPQIRLLDTRKTLPGYRVLDKYAVKIGGGKNHRMGLYDLFMIKDNHIEAAGSIEKAIERCRMYNKKKSMNIPIEIEVKNLRELEESLKYNPDIIMLDNMDDKSIKEAVIINNKRSQLEVSGNITEERLKLLSNLGIDCISMGALTHSVIAFDLSLLIS